MKTMKAVVISSPCGCEGISLSDVPLPEARPGWVLVKVAGFGLNHAEQVVRRFEITEPYIKKPLIPGIECVGTAEDPSDSAFRRGQCVAALMGGMGRSFDGSYAQYVLAPSPHVFAIDPILPWEELAAIPETWYTAWGSLFLRLKLQKGDRLLVRGATCALGQAALKLASRAGAEVFASTHKEEKLKLIGDGAAALLDNGRLSQRLGGAFDKVLDLVGPSCFPDTAALAREGGIVCTTGFLGGGYAVRPFRPILDNPRGAYLTSFWSNSPRQEDLDGIMGFFKESGAHPGIGAVFGLGQIAKAVALQDKGGANGKIVVMAS